MQVDFVHELFDSDRRSSNATRIRAIPILKQGGVGVGVGGTGVDVFVAVGGCGVGVGVSVGRGVWDGVAEGVMG